MAWTCYAILAAAFAAMAAAPLFARGPRVARSERWGEVTLHRLADGRWRACPDGEPFAWADGETPAAAMAALEEVPE